MLEAVGLTGVAGGRLLGGREGVDRRRGVARARQGVVQGRGEAWGRGVARGRGEAWGQGGARLMSTVTASFVIGPHADKQINQFKIRLKLEYN